MRCLSDPGQANVWIAVISYVGNYFWTHYFYNLLGASYTFKAWRINNVPIALFFCTHAYFCFYHTMTTVRPVGTQACGVTVAHPCAVPLPPSPQLLLRRFWTSHAYIRTAGWVKPVASAVLVLVMANVTAFMETLTIASVRIRLGAVACVRG